MTSSAAEGRTRTDEPSGQTPAARPPSPNGADPVAAQVLERVTELRRQWTRSGADIATRLRPGVGADALDAAEELLGLPVPAAARAWFQLVDGVEPVRHRYRTTAPTVGPGGWVPLSLADALDRARGADGLGAPVPPGLLPVFARAEELLAVRLGHGGATIEQLILADPEGTYQHGWRTDLDTLLHTWADAMLAAFIWLPDARDWVTDPFAIRSLPNAYLFD